MARKTIEQIRAELDELNLKMGKRQHISDNMLIKKSTVEYRTNLSKSLTGKNKTLEHIENRKKAMPKQTGENNGFYGKTHTFEVRKQIGASKKGKIAHNAGSTHTEEALEKMRKPRSEAGKEAMRGVKKKTSICPHCGKEGGNGNMMRYHFENCKHK